jgi:hypothetical protein
VTAPNVDPELEPRRPALTAALLYALAALTLCWPMLLGQFLAGPGSDQFLAGYSFRHFAAEYFRQHQAIPQWNPYIFGGLPFVGAAHGDIFYPTAALRWFLPTDVAMNLGFAVHLVLAGLAMYGLLRTLRVSWTGSLVAGLTYELTGIVASLVHPGHDGKLFVSALTPFLLMGIVWAVRDRRWSGFGIMALATGLSLQGHPQASQYLLIAAAVWGAFWLFGGEGPTGAQRWRTLGLSGVAVSLGIGLYAVYALPMLQYVPFSPRGDGGYNTGWEYAKTYALPANELLGVLLPMIDGGTESYFGANGLKLHTEYLGPVAIVLAVLGIRGSDRRVARWAFGTIAVLFLLVSLGGSTPFFRLWYEIVPMAKRLRAPGMAFFLVAAAVAFFAGLGVERLIAAAASRGRLLAAAGIAAGLGLLGAIGALQLVAEDIARTSPYQGSPERAIANAAALQADGLRLLLVTGAAVAAIYLVLRRRVRGLLAVGALLAAGWGDSWLVVRKYFVFSPGAKTSYALDSITSKLIATPKPYRVFGPGGPLERQGLNPYPSALLMGDEIPVLFGYHGNEMTTFDELLGGKGLWRNQTNPALWKMLAIRYVVLTQPQELPGYHQVLGPVTTPRGPAFLFEADTVPPYARVLAGAAKVPEDQLAQTASDPRFPADRLAIYSDAASVSPEPLNNQMPAPSARTATVASWEPGQMRVRIDGESAKPEYLVIAENWYPDWRASIDGSSAPVLRAQNTLLSVVLPPGAQEVAFEFRSAAYARGRLISLASLLGIGVLFAIPLVRKGKPPDG